MAYFATVNYMLCFTIISNRLNGFFWLTLLMQTCFNFLHIYKQFWKFKPHNIQPSWCLKLKNFFFEHRFTKKIKLRFRMVKISILTIIVEHLLPVFFTKHLYNVTKKINQLSFIYIINKTYYIYTIHRLSLSYS